MDAGALEACFPAVPATSRRRPRQSSAPQGQGLRAARTTTLHTECGDGRRGKLHPPRRRQRNCARSPLLRGRDLLVEQDAVEILRLGLERLRWQFHLSPDRVNSRSDGTLNLARAAFVIRVGARPPADRAGFPHPGPGRSGRAAARLHQRQCFRGSDKRANTHVQPRSDAVSASPARRPAGTKSRCAASVTRCSRGSRATSPARTRARGPADAGIPWPCTITLVNGALVAARRGEPAVGAVVQQAGQRRRAGRSRLPREHVVRAVEVAASGQGSPTRTAAARRSTAR